MRLTPVLAAALLIASTPVFAHKSRTEHSRAHHSHQTVGSGHGAMTPGTTGRNDANAPSGSNSAAGNNPDAVQGRTQGGGSSSGGSGGGSAGGR